MNKYNYNFTENDYKTPPEIYNMALQKAGISEFGLDTCCSDNHIPAIMHYSLPVKYGNNPVFKWFLTLDSIKPCQLS